jgi:CHAT domain-containing protein/tetratricopeptide (TPR) repeat protein
MRLAAVRSPSALILICATTGLAVAGDSRRAVPHDPAHLLDQLSEIRLARTLEPQVSIEVEYRPCRLSPPPEDGTVPVPACTGGAPPPDALTLATRAAVAARDGDLRASRAVAITDLLWGNGRVAVEHAVAALSSAARLPDASADVLADLAAAHLLRASAAQSPRDLLEAIEAADRAHEADPANRAAAWNLALALERLGVDGEAVKAWREYLTLDGSSPWAGEARTRIRAIEASHVLPVAKDSTDAALEAYGAAAPQDAATRGWVDELGAWGAAVQHGDSAAAALHLGHAAALARGIVRRGGDASLADAVTAIRAHAADAGATRTLAAAHVSYAVGRRLYAAGDYAGSSDPLERAAREADVGSSSLATWATLFHSATLTYRQQYRDAALAMRRIIAVTAASRYPALVGRAEWMLGSTLMRTPQTSEGLEHVRTAERLLARAGETENAGATSYLVGVGAFLSGTAPDGYAHLHLAMMSLRRFRSSTWLHNQLHEAGTQSLEIGCPRTALRFQNESLEVATGTAGAAIWRTEARLARARVLWSLGRIREGSAEALLAREDLARLPSGPREWFATDLRIADARRWIEVDAGRGVAELDSVFNAHGAAGTPQRSAEARVLRADGNLRLGRSTLAAADLDSVLAFLREEQDAALDPAVRASLVETARPVLERIVMLRIREGRGVDALDALERGREAFLAGRVSDPRPPYRRVAAPNSLALEFALVGDTLITWAVSDVHVQMFHDVLSRDSLGERLEEARGLLASGEETPRLTADLEFLYDRLLRPVLHGHEADAALLTIVADGELSAVPFAALRDSARGRFVVEDHAIRFTSSVWSPVAGNSRGTQVLLVAADARTVSDYGFPPLPNAVAEVRDVAAAYPHARIVTDFEPTRATVMQELPSASVFHYAGHAVFDEDRPERSFLVIGGSGRRAGTITAAELGVLDLRRLQLVVLSACESLPTRPGNTGGFAGFATALLSAGASGVLGSLWSVQDAQVRPFMRAFHREYETRGNAALALREAQIAMLHSKNPRLRSPANWAGFRYVSR